ncbi:MAG: NAD(P)-binding domain-containing protein [Acetobacteraceae bacterium]|nr:NAD(P)-binding domain-containing protein [Acetobacteraceae bacterium]
MSFAIIGFGAVGQAVAKAFARKNIKVAVSGRRPPEALASEAKAIGPTVLPMSVREAAEADTVILAVPFAQHRDVAKAAANWDGKLVIDAMNAFGTPLAEFDGLTSSAVVATAFPGARFLKGFNHLPAAKLAADPNVKGGRRVIFVAGDDAAALKSGAALIKQLGYAPVSLGSLAEGSVLTQARGNSWSPLDFVDLVQFDSE